MFMFWEIEVIIFSIDMDTGMDINSWFIEDFEIVNLTVKQVFVKSNTCEKDIHNRIFFIFY